MNLTATETRALFAPRGIRPAGLLRLYGPLEAWFDKSWKPGDFELVK